MIQIFTDGSAKGNGSKNSIGGFGVVVCESWDSEHWNIIDAYQENNIEGATNNSMELTAILWAMYNYGDNSPTPIVYSDSAYCVNALNDWIYTWKNNGWVRAGGKKLLNQDLIQLYDKLLNTGHKIDLRHVQGHQGNEYNEIADGLATGRLTVEEVLNGEV